METRCNRALMMGSVVMFLAWGGKAGAHSAELVQDVTGASACTVFTIDKIKELNDVPPQPVGGLKDGDGQEITYSIDEAGATLLEFNATQPVNFIILNNLGQAARIFYYGDGAMTDTILKAGSRITVIRYCYGRRLQPEPLAKCDPALCNSDDNAVLVRLDPVDAQRQLEACACGDFERCDPALSAGTAGACKPLGGAPAPFLPIPSKAEVAQDPWVCFTISGKRKCYCLDQDTTKKGCQ